MPSSYQAPMRKDHAEQDSQSQSLGSNLADHKATVGDIIKRKGGDVFSIRPQEELRHAVEVLRDHRIGALLVTDANGALVGILSERDIVRKLADTPGQTLGHKVEDIMTSNVQTCAPDDQLVQVLRRMTDGRFRHMPVIDDTGLAGMITIGDVVNHRLIELEHEALALKQLIVG